MPSDCDAQPNHRSLTATRHPRCPHATHHPCRLHARHTNLCMPGTTSLRSLTNRGTTVPRMAHDARHTPYTDRHDGTTSATRHSCTPAHRWEWEWERERSVQGGEGMHAPNDISPALSSSPPEWRTPCTLCILNAPTSRTRG
jgi:hypothetical protein